MIRRLQPSDVDAFRAVRLDALRLHPEAFGSSYEDEAALDRAEFVERVATAGLVRFGAFDAHGSLVGLIGLQIRSGAKQRHKAFLFSMYVDAAHRGTGLARQLVEAVITAAREAGAIVLQLSVAADNAPAQRLYRRMGFTTYGIDRRLLKVGEHFHDEELMALDLDRG
jgi:ribosomal protein S18 acetylase RimI-like enzyme